MGIFAGLLRRDLLLLSRRPVLWLLPPAFFLLVVAIFSIAAADAPLATRAVAPGVIWTAALFASLLAQDGIFRPDAESGHMEQVLASSRPLPLFALAKAAAHWLLTGLPLAFIAPLAALMLQFPPAALPALLFTLPLGTAVLSLLAAFAASLTLAGNNVLLPVLLVLPLALPVLIFSVAVVSAALSGFPILAPAAFLAALAVLALTFLPLATAGVLRAAGGDG